MTIELSFRNLPNIPEAIILPQVQSANNDDSHMQRLLADLYQKDENDEMMRLHLVTGDFDA